MKMENKKFTKIKVGAALAVALTTGLLSGFNAFAYGPERTTFTDQKPADYVTFNSITNNPSMGDERNFVRIREAGVGNYVDQIDIVPGKTYEVWTYVHNNASETYNVKEHNYKGIAVVGKVDVDNNQQIAMQFGIRNIPTVLIFKNGEVVDKFVGVAPKAAIAEKLNAFL
jgi:hypothetical protein